MVAVRTNGIAFDSIIGYEDTDGRIVPMVSQKYLLTLLAIANKRFAINTMRRDRFRTSLLPTSTTGSGNANWEPAEERKQRKRLEGLKRRQALQAQSAIAGTGTIDPAIELDGVGDTIRV